MKGNKHAQKRVYKKQWHGSKAWAEAVVARTAAHQPKKEKKDGQMKW